MQKNTNMVKRYTMFLVSLLFAGIGISLIAISDLGASAVSSTAYVSSLVFPITFDTATFISNLTFVVLQVLMLRDKFPKSQYMQLIVVPLAGVFIDLGMVLFGGINPSTYIGQMLVLIIGITILAFGNIQGVREGTVLAALLVGPMINVFNKLFNNLENMFGQEKANQH